MRERESRERDGRESKREGEERRGGVALETIQAHQSRRGLASFPSLQLRKLLTTRCTDAPANDCTNTREINIFGSLSDHASEVIPLKLAHETCQVHLWYNYTCSLMHYICSPALEVLLKVSDPLFVHPEVTLRSNCTTTDVIPGYYVPVLL